MAISQTPPCILCSWSPPWCLRVSSLSCFSLVLRVKKKAKRQEAAKCNLGRVCLCAAHLRDVSSKRVYLAEQSVWEAAVWAHASPPHVRTPEAKTLVHSCWPERDATWKRPNKVFYCYSWKHWQKWHTHFMEDRACNKHITKTPKGMLGSEGWQKG
eukprot:3010178-Amphidinium_carterae.1